ncbi:hypothetical protein GCM10022252_04950 [Streptosporangium oxazolinicum]|uniref:MFS transporter n=1 Tax=Streptosporangium oxazolinicum TaxID=909287 RepID=A0ABP8AB57_9ACTN
MTVRTVESGTVEGKKETTVGRVLTGTAGVGGPLGLGIAGAPWGVVFALSALALAIACLQSVFPQESAHRLAWWRSHWQSRERRSSRRSAGLRDPTRIDHEA